MKTIEKVAHLYRRFGFGVTPNELEEGAKVGVSKTLEKLLNPVDPEPPAAPSEFFWREKEEADLGTWRVRCWWVYRMLTSKRPLQEKMALFWHNHFAVSDAKVEDGPMMLDYLRVLQTHGTGRFVDLLTAVATNPAMMRYLDMNRSVRGNPNENFAREVMELFTLGIGNYTEDDVKEVARALTGWGFIHTYWEMPGTADDKLKESMKYDRPFSTFTWMPVMHDPGEKTILGKKENFDGDEVMKLLATHPATAKHLARKLWEFFVYTDPEPKVVDTIASVFLRSKGDIKQTLRAIATHPEFYSERADRAIVKSPVDLCVPVARQMAAGDILTKACSVAPTPYDRIPQVVIDQCGGLAWWMERQGLSLLYPPDVSGWRWNQAWATPDAMAHRFNFRGLMLWGEKGPGEGGKAVQSFLVACQPKDGAEIALAFLRLFDVRLQPARTALIAKLWDDHGGAKALADAGTATWLADRTLGLVMATPESQLF